MEVKIAWRKGCTMSFCASEHYMSCKAMSLPEDVLFFLHGLDLDTQPVHSRGFVPIPASTSRDFVDMRLQAQQ